MPVPRSWLNVRAHHIVCLLASSLEQTGLQGGDPCGSPEKWSLCLARVPEADLPICPAPAWSLHRTREPASEDLRSFKECWKSGLLDEILKVPVTVIATLDAKEHKALSCQVALSDHSQPFLSPPDRGRGWSRPTLRRERRPLWLLCYEGGN